MRAQVWSLDLSVSVLIFFSALAVIMFTWNYVNVQNAEQAEIRNMEALALSVSEQVIRIPGMPKDWNSSSVEALGLASNENILNDSKVEELLKIGYSDAKNLLGIGTYEFRFGVKYLNNTAARTLSGTEISYGLEPSNERIVVPVERYCMLNGEMVRLDLTIWAGF